MKRLRSQTGYILLPVVVAITLVAAIALMINTESAIETSNLGSELEVQRVGYVTEAGLNHALWQTARQGCGAYTDLTNINFGGDLYSSSLTTDLGTTTSYSILLDQDSWIRNDHPTENKGADVSSHIRFEGGNIERAMYRYDLSSIPPNTAIISATAWFYITIEHPEGAVDIHPLTAGWTETDATWNSMANSMDSTVIATIPAQPDKNLWIPVNLTSQVQSWVNGQSNYGITMNASSEGLHAQYFSRESAFAPYLEVIGGTAPSSPASLTATGTLTNGISRTMTREDVMLHQQPFDNFNFQPDAVAGIDSYISKFSKNTNYGNADETWVASGGANEKNALFKFDLRVIPPAANIQSAVLSVYHRDGDHSNVPVSAHRITNAWLENEVTWNNRTSAISWDKGGGDFEAEAEAMTHVGPADDQRYEWDITGLVKGWVDGSYTNNGVVLRTEENGIWGERFNTSDFADPSQHPRLQISYGCRCEVSCLRPQGSGDIAMIGNYISAFPDPRDLEKQAVIESWGYDVDIYDDNTIGTIDISDYNLIYVSDTAWSTTVGTLLTNLPIGIVDEEGTLSDELEIASDITTSVGKIIDIVDNSHYITLPFSAGPLPIYTADMEFFTASGTLAAGSQTLANVGTTGSLVLLESAAQMTGGGNVPARRVVLPLGSVMSSNFNWRYLNNNGRLIVQRAIEWGMNKGAVSSSPNFWISTRSDVTSSDAPGLNTWSSGEVLAFGGFGLELEPGTTTGIFSSISNLDAFAGNVKIDAMHFVDSDITVGSANSIALRPGDLLLSTDNDETLVSSNSLAVKEEDVFVFRPNTPGDYSVGTFILLLEGALVHAENDTVAISLVENNTIVGDGSLNRGDFILSTTNRRDVQLFDVTDVGLGTTSGSLTEFIDGLTLDLGSEIRGIDLAEEEITLGGHTVPAGSILLSLRNDDTSGVGDNLIAVDGSDIFYLDVIQVGSSPVADAILLFEGLDVNLDTDNEHLEGLAISRDSTLTNPIQVLFVVPDATALGPQDTSKKEIMETWGFIVNLITASSSQAGFDAAVATADVAYISEEAASADTGDKLRDATIGVVNEETSLSDDYGISSSHTGYNGTQIEVVNNSHYITSVFTIGPLSISSSSNALDRRSGTLAPGLYSLAESGGNSELSIIDSGGLLYDSGTAAGRRVQLPWGTDDFDIDLLNANGLMVMRRAIEWGAGIGDDNPPYPGYTEAYVPLSASSSNAWEPIDLSGFGVPAEAIVEVAVVNTRGNRERWGGVRASGSPLDRRLQLREAESGGVDVMVLHVQADTSSVIEIYAENTGDISFILLGYWGSGTFVEAWDNFDAGANNVWQSHSLSAYGVTPDAVAEILLYNESVDPEFQGGVRTTGSVLPRLFDITEAENGGKDMVSLLVKAGGDAGATVEVFAESDANIDFYLSGHWSNPPGVYSETFAEITGSPASNGAWDDKDLSGLGVPANAIVQVVIANGQDDIEADLGVRETGSSLDRHLDQQEAEDGGDDLGSMHVNTDAGSTIQWYDQDTGRDHRFYLLGWWSLSP